MGSVEEKIQSALSDSGLPVYFSACKEPVRPPQYITWTMALIAVELYGDDLPLELGFYIQVSLWSKTEYFAVAETIRSSMQAAGFQIKDERDLEYDPETQYYGRNQRYFYLNGSDGT